MKIQLLFFAYLLFCIGCNQYKNNSERIILNSRSYDYGLMQQNILYFPLDSISAFDTKSLQVFNKGLDIGEVKADIKKLDKFMGLDK